METLNIDRLFQNFEKKIEPECRIHLKKVYSCLTMCVIAAALGSFLMMSMSIRLGFGGLILNTLLSVGLCFGVMCTGDTPENKMIRFGMLMGFSFFTGISLGPLIGLAVALNPTIIPTAFLVAASVFVCFTAASLFAPDGYYLAIGGSITSGLMTLSLLGFANVFFQSYLVFQFQLWFGLLVFCGFVVWDTQMIIFKRRAGDKDYMLHSLNLFIDFVHIFKHMLVLLIQKEDNRERRRRRS